MPVTRSQGKGRRLTREQKPSSSEDTAATGVTTAMGTTEFTGTLPTSVPSAVASSAIVAATSEPFTTETGTSATGSSATMGVITDTGTKEYTVTLPTTTPSVTAFSNAAAAHSVTLSAATVTHCDTETRQHTETSTVKRVMNTTTGLPLPSRHQDSLVTCKKEERTGSTHSKSKAYKIAKAKEDLLRIKFELADQRLAATEIEDTEYDEEDDVSIYSKETVNRRVDSWLENQANSPVHEKHIQEVIPAATVNHHQASHHLQQSPAGVQPEITALAEAITRAVTTAQRPKFIELPFFSGSHHEWLPFRAAYYETEDQFTIIENMNRLRRNLKGKAKKAVEGLLIANTHPAEVMRSLESRFGRPESIAIMEMDTLRELPRLSDSPRDICIFATKVSNAVATLKTLSCINYLYNPELSRTVVNKLTPTLRYRYYDFSAMQPKDDPDLVKLEKFLKREAELCGPYALPEQVTATPEKKTHKVVNVQEKTNVLKCPACEGIGHSTMDCEQFKKLDKNERWDTAKSKRLCFRCLRYRSKTHSCRPRPCGVNGCRYSHNRLLHYTKKTDDTETNEDKKKEATEVITSARTMERKQSYLKILPIQVKGPRGAVDTYALLDDGSTVTLIDDSIVQKIGATGPIDPLKMETINGLKSSESASRRVIITLKGLNDREEQVHARTVKNLQVSSQRVPREVLEGCKHLIDICEYLTYSEAKPQVLIGQDNWHLLLTTEVRRGDSKQPVASLTSLGWVLHGSRTRTLGHNIDFVSYNREEPKDNIEELVKQYFEMDALCINPKKPTTDPEERALRELEKITSRTEDGRFETGLLWRTKDVTLPDNYENALKRLFNIENKLDRDPVLKQRYSEQMEALIRKGYAEPAPKQKSPGKTWYLPHFAVINPMKPEKLRVVHNAAAKTKGVALNDVLLKGPDLLQSLPGVIMRFRQHKIAVTADIKEMFMQVKLRNEDRDSLRYLWRGNKRDPNPPEEFRMTSLIFGASCSPSTAIFVKNLNAKQHEHNYPEAAAAIVQKHYVDDYLDSFRTIEDAERITKSVREVHMKACFELKQWKSNSSTLLEALAEHQNTEDMELYSTKDKTERLLGVIWKINSDELTFNLNSARIPPPLIEGKKPTKREALRIVMSLFDPLGLVSPVTIRAKQLLQEVWRRGTAWDDEIDEDLAEQWANWLIHLKNLCHVTIPRRYLYYSDTVSLQLHVFTDASESAYSAVLFWRTVTANGEIGVSLILAKAKVAPLKLTSIPRLELQAAVMGVRLAEAVIEGHEKKPDLKVFWTDSRTVLTWIKTGSRSYKPYVAHRLAAIEESSKVDEWCWIPTKLNVADDATRDVPTNFDKNHGLPI